MNIEQLSQHYTYQTDLDDKYDSQINITHVSIKEFMPLLEKVVGKPPSDLSHHLINIYSLEDKLQQIYNRVQGVWNSDQLDIHNLYGQELNSFTPKILVHALVTSLSGMKWCFDFQHVEEQKEYFKVENQELYSQMANGHEELETAANDHVAHLRDRSVQNYVNRQDEHPDNVSEANFKKIYQLFETVSQVITITQDGKEDPLVVNKLSKLLQEEQYGDITLKDLFKSLKLVYDADNFGYGSGVHYANKLVRDTQSFINGEVTPRYYIDQVLSVSHERYSVFHAPTVFATSSPHTYNIVDFHDTELVKGNHTVSDSVLIYHLKENSQLNSLLSYDYSESKAQRINQLDYRFQFALAKEDGLLPSESLQEHWNLALEASKDNYRQFQSLFTNYQTQNLSVANSVAKIASPTPEIDLNRAFTAVCDIEDNRINRYERYASFFNINTFLLRQGKALDFAVEDLDIEALNKEVQIYIADLNENKRAEQNFRMFEDDVQFTDEDLSPLYDEEIISELTMVTPSKEIVKGLSIPLEGLEVANINTIGATALNIKELADHQHPVAPAVVFTVENSKLYNTDKGLWLKSIRPELNKMLGTGKLSSVSSSLVRHVPGVHKQIMNVGIDNSNYSHFCEKLGTKTTDQCITTFMQTFCSEILNETPQFSSNLPKALFQFRQVLNRHGVSQDFDGLFPLNSRQQYKLALEGIFSAWNTVEASNYRTVRDIPDDIGLGAVIQEMKFGNFSQNSCSGFIITRNPQCGTNEIIGQYVPQSQDEVIDNSKTNQKTIADLAIEYPEIYRQLISISEKIETSGKAIQKITFTVEDGQLYINDKSEVKAMPLAKSHLNYDLYRSGQIDKDTLIQSIAIESFTDNLRNTLEGSDYIRYNKSLESLTGKVFSLFDIKMKDTIVPKVESKAWFEGYSNVKPLSFFPELTTPQKLATFMLKNYQDKSYLCDLTPVHIEKFPTNNIEDLKPNNIEDIPDLPTPVKVNKILAIGDYLNRKFNNAINWVSKSKMKMK